jgi:hypothetical protein
MSDEIETAHESRELVERQVFLANAFVTPFAAAVAAELEEFGLSKSKIDEILLRSAKRFGELREDMFDGLDNTDATRSEKGAGVWSDLWNAGGQLWDYLAAAISTHGPRLADKVAPIVEDAVITALREWFNSKGRSKGRSR